PAFVVVTLAKLGPLAIHAFKLSRRGEQGALHFVWWAYKKLIILGVLLALSASWFFSAAFFRKLLILFQAIFRTSGGEMITGFWQGLFYYPGAIIAHYSFSPWLGVLIVVALLKPFIASSYRQLDKLYAFIWTVILLITLTVSAKAPQFIYIIGPFLFILFAAAFFYWADKLDKKYVAALSLAVFLPAVVSLPALWGEYFPPRPAENMLSVLKYFRSQAQTRDALACSFNLQRLNPEVVAFHFWDWNAPVLSDQALGEDAMFGNAGILFSLKLEPDSPIIGQVLDDSHARWNIFLEGKMRQKLIREVSVRNFAALGLTAKIYAKSGY
ncbi:MAG TPA: hypothetical protein VMT55_01970, partial [Candidatus Sulfotelmatobacter sp.]|nr:hypothetical protein [Candidatus Sulfotelmatobacter sp.]